MLSTRAALFASLIALPAYGLGLVRPGSCMFVNQATLDLLKEREGFVRTPSPDPIGQPTVGYGHQCRIKDCGEVAEPFPLSVQSADRLLKQDIVPFAQCLAATISPRVRINANQWGALVSWAYNVGTESVRHSALVRRLNNGEDPYRVAREEFPGWDNAGGITLLGLIRRREAEVRLFALPSNDTAHPYCTTRYL